MPFSSAIESPEWEWGEAFLLDSGDHLPTPLTRVSCGSLYVGSSNWMIASAVDESWSLLTPGGCSHRRCNFPLQFVAHEAAWETGPKCILGHAIPLPETAEGLPVCGINTLIRYQSLPGSGLCWPLSVPCLLTAFAQDSHAGLLRIPHSSLYFVSPIGFSHPLCLPFFFTLRLAYPLFIL